MARKIVNDVIGSGTPVLDRRSAERRVDTMLSVERGRPDTGWRLRPAEELRTDEQTSDDRVRITAFGTDSASVRWVDVSKHHAFAGSGPPGHR